MFGPMTTRMCKWQIKPKPWTIVSLTFDCANAENTDTCMYWTSVLDSEQWLLIIDERKTTEKPRNVHVQTIICILMHTFMFIFNRVLSSYSVIITLHDETFSSTL